MIKTHQTLKIPYIMKKNLYFPSSKKTNELSILALFYLNLLSVKLPNNKEYLISLPVISQEKHLS